MKKQTLYTPKGKISKRVKQKKLIDKKFAQSGNFLIDKLDIKGKVYRQVVCLVEGESLTLGEQNLYSPAHYFVLWGKTFI